MKPSYILFALYVIVFPFYFFERGNPQIADIFGVVIVLVNLKDILLSFKATSFTKGLFLFVCYTIIVNTIWMALIGELLLLKSSFYYIYSFFLMLAFYTKLKDQKFTNLLVYALCISLVLQFLLWPFISGQGVRTMMFFKNPNQLSFWAFSMLIISYLIHRLSSTKTYLLYALLLLSTFFIFISASKSGLAGAIIFWVYFFSKSAKQLALLATLSIVVIAILFSTDRINFNNVAFINNVVDRITEKKVSGISSLEDRGYDRITNYPQYLLFGAGEGEYKRFGYRIELHSTLFNILFSYGFIGLFLFGYALFQIIHKSPINAKVLLFTVILYTLAHMTLRSPLFWISLLLIHQLKYQSLKLSSKDD